jgi:hypothetical protein
VEIDGKKIEKYNGFFDTKLCKIPGNEVCIMTSLTEPMLFIDIQSLPPADYCPVCGGERYAPSLICLRCERRKP